MSIIPQVVLNPQAQPVGEYSAGMMQPMISNTPDWDAEFIKQAFEQLGQEVLNVKMVQDRFGTQPASYCFVEFSDGESARNTMLALSGRSIPNDLDKTKFNLSFANSPNQCIEYNLFASNLSSSVDDTILFRLFGERYPSCRGQKSTGMQMQKALVELNKHRLKGKEMVLKLAIPKDRRNRPFQPRGSFSGGHREFRPRYQSAHVPMVNLAVGAVAQQSYGYGSNHGVAGFGSQVQQVYNSLAPMQTQPPYLGNQYSGMSHSQGYHSSRGDESYRRSHRSHQSSTPYSSVPAVAPVVGPPPPVYFEGEEPLTAEEHNNLMIEMSADFLTSLESSRWNRVDIPMDVRPKELTTLLYSKT
uniref:tRNA selenocysteine-associated protein 1 n=1 Tax=Ditylenchus dipsaci TaxID=166011 RepID=A0A915E7P7_9BILA